MVSEKDIFCVSGPKHLTSIDWSNKDHCRSVAACLVQAVYVLERDRQLNRQFPDNFAPAWWEFFHFDLIRKLIDDADMSIFGAIFELNPPILKNSDSPMTKTPRFVIAFRGTITEKHSISRDLTLDLHLVQNGLHKTSRFLIAMQALKNVVSQFPNSEIWICGHSLGSGIGMLVSRNMVKTGKPIPTFLFNPPFCSAPIENIKDERVKQGIRIASSLLTAGLSLALKPRNETPVLEDNFEKLSMWVPQLFVNPNDHLCSEYIGYFEHRDNMDNLGAGSIERLATRNSIGDLFLRFLGRESEPLHLVPSANLCVNLGISPDFKWAHGIMQWWQNDLCLSCKEYRYI
ncbi:hypothetical protein LUZ60_012611 [Juncus effusus]|nr:hypothetical protein LUZ60_012611 [Juncus effusus]